MGLVAALGMTAVTRAVTRAFARIPQARRVHREPASSEGLGVGSACLRSLGHLVDVGLVPTSRRNVTVNPSLPPSAVLWLFLVVFSVLGEAGGLQSPFVCGEGCRAGG